MPLLPQRFIDDLKLQANILQVVQEYVPLKKAGTTYKGLCPFHGEKSPSFHVNPEKGFFHCFGCGVGGDVFKFLELHEKVTFHEAVRMLAQKLGVAIPDDGDGDRERQDTSLREALLKVHEVAAAWFREQLTGPAGGIARRQVEERGVTPAVSEKLGLGYAPPTRDGLKQRLLKQGFAQALLVQSGLVVQRDSGEVIDRFRNRLMVPICRESGSVIAFGGRSLEKDQVPKYLNSPETAIYSKGRTLYGLNLTKAAIRKLGYVILVEGYFDFAQVYQSLNAPVVASCGTALTVQQAHLLRRFASRVVLSYDPDAAGQGAAARSSELLVTEGFDVNVAMMDKGEDPDTFIRRHGGDAYRAKLRSSRPYLEYLLDRASTGVDFGRDDARRQFLGDMLAVAARIPDAAARDQFADRIAFKARITEDVVRAEIRKAAVNRVTKVTTKELPTFGPMKSAETGLIWSLIHSPGPALQALDTLDAEDFEGLSGRAIFLTARDLAQGALAPTELPSALLQRLNTVEAQAVTSVAATPARPAPPDACARALKRLRLERDRASIQREIDRLQQLGAGQHGGEINALWQRKVELLHRIEETS